jgi:hypothetical protein
MLFLIDFNLYVFAYQVFMYIFYFNVLLTNTINKMKSITNCDDGDNSYHTRKEANGTIMLSILLLP